MEFRVTDIRYLLSVLFLFFLYATFCNAGKSDAVLFLLPKFTSTEQNVCYVQYEVEPKQCSRLCRINHDSLVDVIFEYEGLITSYDFSVDENTLVISGIVNNGKQKRSQVLVLTKTSDNKWRVIHLADNASCPASDSDRVYYSKKYTNTFSVESFDFHDGKTRIFKNNVMMLYSAVVSPNGRYLAYNKSDIDTPGENIAVDSIPSGNAIYRDWISSNPVLKSRLFWDQDSSGFCFFTGKYIDGGPLALYKLERIIIEGGSVLRKVVFSFHSNGIYGLSPDHSQYIIYSLGEFKCISTKDHSTVWAFKSKPIKLSMQNFKHFSWSKDSKKVIGILPDNSFIIADNKKGPAHCLISTNRPPNNHPKKP